MSMMHWKLPRVGLGIAVVAALAGVLLLPMASSAVVLDPLQHFLLDSSPYLHDDPDPAAPGSYDGDGTTPVQGVNVPDTGADTVDLSTQVPMGEGSMDQWMRLTSTDYTAEVDVSGLSTPGIPTPGNAALLGVEWTITLDDSFQIAEEAMTTESGNLKVFFVIWSVRPVNDINQAIQSPAVIGGFDKDSFEGDLLSGPLLADASNANAPIPFPDLLFGDPNNPTTPGSPGTHMDHGMGVKIELEPGGASAVFTADYFAGQDLNEVFFIWDAYWYKNDPVPEPAGLLLVGLIGLGLARRRRSAA